MKKLLSAAAILVFLSGCIFSDAGKSKSNALKGDTDLPINEVGNTFESWISIPGVLIEENPKIEVSKIEGDITSISIKGKIPENLPFSDLLVSEFTNADGELDCEVKFKITDEGILDYNNSEGKPFLLVKNDAKVGDVYTLEKSNGTTITREVVRKSEEDDFYWSGMNIKTIDVEHYSKLPGVYKITYLCNHKFGIVAIRYEMEDGSNCQIELYPNLY